MQRADLEGQGTQTASTPSGRRTLPVINNLKPQKSAHELAIEEELLRFCLLYTSRQLLGCTARRRQSLPQRKHRRARHAPSRAALRRAEPVMGIAYR